MNYDKILVKIDDKIECNLLRNCLKERCKVALYAADDKDTKLNEDGLFYKNADVVISTSSIQNGLSIKEDIDTLSCVKEYLGRNRKKYDFMRICC